NVLNAYFRDPQNDARVVGQRAVRLVKVLRVTPLPPPARNTWNVLWRETEIAHGTDTRTVTTWEAYLTVRRSAPRGEERKTEEQISHNPLGVYIADLSWSAVADPGSTR
ncbi:MAG TPA: type IV secretion system protein, partial [Longimicrobiaceae bacterium]|nr:type IV secretion system protein [Longimicrobiaceae bacterium]